jgi:hypothetical protein
MMATDDHGVSDDVLSSAERQELLRLRKENADLKLLVSRLMSASGRYLNSKPK